MAGTVVVLVEAIGAGAPANGGVVDGIERAGRAGLALEDELARRAREPTNAVGLERVSRGACASSLRDYLIALAGEAVALAVQNLIVLTLTNTGRTLGDLSWRTGACIAVVDHRTRANCADAVDQKSVGKGGAICAYSC